MTDDKKPFVATLWKTGSPIEFAAKELVGAKNWEEAKVHAEEWAVVELSAGGITHPTFLHLKHGAKGEKIRDWHGV